MNDTDSRTDLKRSKTLAELQDELEVVRRDIRYYEGMETGMAIGLLFGAIFCALMLVILSVT